LTYQSLEWKGQIAIEADPAHLSLAAFETTKDNEKLTMVNRSSSSAFFVFEGKTLKTSK